MVTFFTTLLVGIVVIVLGIINMTGNISSLHGYHRHRVSEADVKPFGFRVGLGTVISGAVIVLFGALMFLYEQTGTEWLSWVATAQLIVGIAVGMIITFRAMIKYNGGIF